ncbi:unnamed protein product [Diamesa serratosioi]
MESNNEFFKRKDIFPDHPTDGPLAEYRKSSTFDWKKMKLLLEDEAALELRAKVWNFMETDKLFARDQKEQTLDEVRHLATKRMFSLYNERFYGIEDYIARPDLSGKFVSSIISYDPNVSVKLSLAFGMFPNVIRSLGSDRLSDCVEENMRMENWGCFALTEIGHGSNARGMKTTATFDTKTQSFVLNTPNFEAAKCWAGNLGQTATHAIVYAQLITPDNVNHGLNAFLVAIRDKRTMLTFPAVTIGDLGEKIGLNGIDNGFMLFDNYLIPKDNLLSKTGDVDVNGKYVSQYKDKRSRLGASLGALSGGRVSICEIATTYAIKAMSIAVRYSASRRQFGPEDSDIEYPVLEYQAQQYRLLPWLASTYAIKIFASWIGERNGDMTLKLLMGENVSAIGMEIHALSSAAKPVCTWTARDAIQECREACGGHGYLKVSQLGELRNDNDANCTYEGENNILIQQASNWLLNVRSKGYATFKDCSPLSSASFFQNAEQIMKTKFTWTKPECVMKPENLLSTFDWICVYMLEKTAKRIEQLQSKGMSTFDVRNDSQAFYAINLAIVYGQRNIFNVFANRVRELEKGPESAVLRKLLSLYGANLIVKNYLGVLYEGGFIENSKVAAGDLYNEGILNLLPQIKDEAISLIDSVAPPDFILNSPLGMSDGKVYNHLKSALYQSPETFERPKWWKDMVYRDGYMKSKI